MDPEEIAERRRVKAQKKAEALARQQEREAKEQAVADQHIKLEKSMGVMGFKRLDYLLKQSSIFAKLKMGHDHEPEKKEEEEKAKAHHRGKNAEVATEEDEELDDDEAEPVFLTKQPSTIKFGTMKPYQLEGLNWMIHLGSKGLNGILADEMVCTFSQIVPMMLF
jgi:SWI/SNF-related matrix-associated actin-dependent regulator of chromatin subfamily A member 5